MTQARHLWRPLLTVSFICCHVPLPAADGGEYIADQSLAGCLINTKGNLLHKCSRSRR